jgi:SNF2 family DNA or RNA helicase
LEGEVVLSVLRHCFPISDRSVIAWNRTKSADETAIQRSAGKVEALNRKLRKIMISRKKEEVLKDELPEKTEEVVLCELSPFQKQVYKNVLQLPDFQLVKTGSAPCDCSVNALYFKRYQKLKSPAERLEYSRKHKDTIVKRRKCCYMLPLNPKRDEAGEPNIDPDAALWRMQDAHEDGEACEMCPLCCMLPAFIKL